MFSLEEYYKFKQILESDIVAKKINEVEKENRPTVIASLLNYLSLVKDYENIQCYINDFLVDDHKEVHLLPIDFLEEKKGLSPNEIDNLLYTTLMNDGYLYHVTKSENLDSILEQGLVSLNKRFNENVYEECIKVNETFKTILKKNNKILMDLINIPGHRDLYKTRFKSVYLGTNLAAILNTYGSNMELFLTFLYRLGNLCCLNQEDWHLSREKIREKLIKGMQRYQYDQKELDIILSFYDKHYEQIRLDNKLDEKAIIIVPNKNIQDKSRHSMLCSYNNLKKDKINFRYNYQYCNDIEYPYDIKPDDLIAITIEKDNSLKVHKKSKQ